MAQHPDRLKRLVRLQGQVKALHETRRAMHLSQAADAQKEAVELVEAQNASLPLAGAFSDIYSRRIGSAIERNRVNAGQAEEEAGRLVTATVRVNIAERAWREAMRLHERHEAEKEQLENVERGLTSREAK